MVEKLYKTIYILKEGNMRSPEFVFYLCSAGDMHSFIIYQIFLEKKPEIVQE